MSLKLDFKDIFESGIYTNADYCRKLEKKLGEMYCCKAIVCSSGSAGLLMALYYWFGDKETITLPVFNWFSDKMVIELLNKEPIFYDINLDSWMGCYKDDLNLRLLTFGNIDNSEKDNCIFDATHNIGCKFPTLGLATVISFAATKLVTAAEGGIILSPHIENETINLRNRCFRMSEFHAKIGLEYLKHLDEFLLWKKKVFYCYSGNIEGKFQEFHEGSNYNTIGFINTRQLKIPEEIEYKQYYEPLEQGFPNADYVYKNIIVLPSYYNCNYRKIVELIEDANK